MEDKINDRIKKLLRMQNGGTAAEVDNALKLAKNLADKYNIDMSKIDSNYTRESITHVAEQPTSKLQTEAKYSIMIVQKFFNVDVLINHGFFGKSVIFIGTKTDIEIAMYVFAFLVRHFRHEWKTKRGRCRNRQAFMNGMYEGLFHKLYYANEMGNEKEGLVLSSRAEERKDYLRKSFGETTKLKVEPNRDSVIARDRGIRSGLRTEIRKGVDGKKTTRLLNSGT